MRLNDGTIGDRIRSQDIRLSETSGWLVSGYGVPRWDCTRSRGRGHRQTLPDCPTQM